jgi:hypothetical protein
MKWGRFEALGRRQLRGEIWPTDVSKKVKVKLLGKEWVLGDIFGRGGLLKINLVRIYYAFTVLFLLAEKVQRMVHVRNRIL